VSINGNSLKYIRNQSIEICKKSVIFNGLNLEHVLLIYQTDEICKLAIQNNPYALQFVNNQTNDLCKYAVSINGMVLKYVQHRTDDICEIAVNQNGLSLIYVLNKTDKICQIALKQNELSSRFIKKTIQPL
jgi:hypothetical protein